jgi:hypothetical protein
VRVRVRAVLKSAFPVGALRSVREAAATRIRVPERCTSAPLDFPFSLEIRAGLVRAGEQSKPILAETRGVLVQLARDEQDRSFMFVGPDPLTTYASHRTTHRTTHRIALRIASHRIALRIASHRIALRIASYRIASHRCGRHLRGVVEPKSWERSSAAHRAVLNTGGQRCGRLFTHSNSTGYRG